MTHQSISRYSYTEVFERTVIISKKYFKEIAILSAIIYSLSTTVSLIFGPISSPVFCLFTLISIVYLFSIFQSHETQKTIDLDQLLFQKSQFQKLGKIVKPFLVLTLMLILLSFALVIPALIFGVFWSFWELIALEKDLPPKEILEYSKKLVTGSWWYIFIYFVITAFISNLPSSIIYSIFTDSPFFFLISNLLSGFLTSIFIIGFMIIYRNLQKIHH